MNDLTPGVVGQSAPVIQPAPEVQRERGVFTEGSTMRHVVVMTATGSVGLIAIFMVDLLSLLYVSWLGDKSLTAGVGFATVLMFLAISVNIGLMIATSALVARALGSGDRAAARRLGASATVHLALVSGLVVIGMYLAVPDLLRWIGATGEAHEVAMRFLWISLPSNVLMALGMGFSGILRAIGDARRAMNVTLSGGIATAVADPVLIFGLGLGTDGAAIGLIVARVVFFVMGWYGVVRVHGLLARPATAAVLADLRPMLAVAGPAILTNVATPVSSAFVAAISARFGDQVIAANAVIDRLVPVAFAALFALTGAVGPILSQNWGAGLFPRIRQALADALLFTTLYVGAIWLLLALAAPLIVELFALTGMAADMVLFFCRTSGAVWLCIGFLFVANSAFNNLGFPFYSTAFNWARATLGTLPFVWLGAEWFGPPGIIIGIGVGASAFGIAAVVTAFRAVRRLERVAAVQAGERA